MKISVHLSSLATFLLLLVLDKRSSTLASVPEQVKKLISHGYHNTTEALSEAINKITQDYPDAAESFIIGQSIDNNPILGLKIACGKNEIVNKTRPGFALLGGIHGDHALGHEFVLYLGAFLLDTYTTKQDKRVNDLLETSDLFLIPSLNPDGFQRAREGDCYSAKLHSGRNNLADVDLDTDFKFHNYNDISAVLANNKLQKETKAFLEWLITKGKGIQMFATLRTGLTGITYPFDEVPDQTTEHTYFHSGASTLPNASPDASLFEFIGRGIYYKYQPEPIESVCNPLSNNITVLDGASVGSTYGTMNDFLYKFTNIFPLNIYLDCCKYPKTELLETLWIQHASSLVALLGAMKLGISGTVKEKSSGKPIPNARIVVLEIEKNITTSDIGEYWRPLPPNQKFELLVEAPGYKPQQVSHVQGSDPNFITGSVTPVIINFDLEPIKEHSSTIATTQLDSTTEKQEIQKKSSKPSLVDLPPTSVLKPAALFKDVDQQISKLDFKSPTELQKHHNYDEMTTVLKSLAEKYPTISRLYDIGQSIEKRKLWVLEISDKPGVHQLLRPEFRYIANMHGNEVVGRELLLNLAKLLLENYNSNSLVSALVNSTRIHLLISMNPDGYELAQEGDCESEQGRGNANNLDLNRNFPDRFFHTKENEDRQPEVEAVMSWSKEMQFALGANLHGGSVVANYPYDGNAHKQNGQYEASPDDGLFVHLAKTYSFNHPSMSKGEHCFDICGDDKRSLLNERFQDGITNGARWYVLYGGIQDWVYLNSNCFSITVELGCTKFPEAKDMNRYWSDNKKPLIKYMLEVHRGIYGVVTDQKGLPLGNATISIRKIDHDVHSLKTGDYWRLLLPGEYFVSVSKEGYRAAHRNVVVGQYDSAAVRVDFSLSSGPKELSLNAIDVAGDTASETTSEQLTSKYNQYQVDVDKNHIPKKIETTIEALKLNPNEKTTIKTEPILDKAYDNSQLAGGSKLVKEGQDTKYMLALCFLFVLPGILLLVYLFGSIDGKRYPQKLGFSRVSTGTSDELEGDDDDEGTRFMKRPGKGPKFTSLQNAHGSDSEDELYSVDTWNK